MSQAKKNMEASLNARGYAVLAALEPQTVGQLLSPVNEGDPFNEFHQPFIVIAPTDKADFEAQCVLGGDLPYVDPAYLFFYKVTTD